MQGALSNEGIRLLLLIGPIVKTGHKHVLLGPLNIFLVMFLQMELMNKSSKNDAFKVEKKKRG